MKKILPFILSIVIPVIGFSQADSASTGAGYIYQSFYSFENGVVKQSTSDWDLAFGLDRLNFDIRTNDGHNVELYLYPNGDTSSWASVDTTGLSMWKKRFNGEDYWSNTAFTDPNSFHPDYGWGVYNSTTHNVIGDSIYILKTKAGSYKKLRIDGMFTNGEFNFTYADLDGSNEMSGSIDKLGYPGKTYAYYSIDNNTVLDLEPLAADWDILFTKFQALQPQGSYRSVSGIQTNNYRTTAEARGVDINNVDWSTQNYEDEIGVIGWDWKSFNMGTFSYDIIDSLTYFVQDTAGNVTQITMTGFDYQIGTYYFNIDKVISVGVESFEAGLNTVSVFPNPATEQVSILIKSSEIQNGLNLTIYSLTGQVVYNQVVNVVNNVDLQIPVSNWNQGMYLVRIGNDENAVVKQLVIQ